MATRLMLVEDEADIRDNYVQFLHSQGYEVDACPDRSSAMRLLTERLPDAAIIDIGLGQEVDGGFELCRWLRARSETLPIVFLTARDSDIDTIIGLRLGADDYLSKDVSLPQLAARIATLMRRVRALQSNNTETAAIHCEALCLEPETLRVSWQQQAITLTVTEFTILHCLVRNPGHIKSRDQLMQAADVIVDDSTINSHIKRIRRKFEGIDPAFDAIEAVYGAGYRWRTHHS